MVICVFMGPVPCGTRTHVCLQCTYMRTRTLDLRGQQAPLTGLQSHVSATSLQPQRREVCVKRLSRAVTAHRFVGLSPQADFTGDPVSSSCMGPTTQLTVPSAAGVAREEPAPSIQSHPAQHQGSPGPCWGPWAAHVTSLSSSFSDPIHSVYPVRRGLKGRTGECKVVAGGGIQGSPSCWGPPGPTGEGAA